MTAPIRPAAAVHLDLAGMIDDPETRIVVCCGSGGVGKTTTAAAIGLRAAERGRKVVVLTIDPARRLAQSMGVADLGNVPQRVQLADEVPGELHAMMLDMRRTFDDMITQHTTPEKAAQIFANPVYQVIASSFGGTQEYMAMEKLSQLAATDEWDLVVVDTPPSRNALDFLDAPKRLGSFLDGRMIRLFLPGRGISRIVTGAVSLALRAISTIVGGQMLKDVSTFVESIDSMFGGFQERADRTYALLARRGTQFLVIAAPEPDALREASFFVDRLGHDNMPLAGLIVNRTHPLRSRLPRDHALTAADRLESEDGLESDDGDQLTAAVLRVHAHRADTAKRETHLLKRFTRAHPEVAIATIPALPFEVADLQALRAVGDRLLRRA